MIKDVQLIIIKPREGMVAIANVTLDVGIFLGSIGVHKKLDGTGYRITYPTKKIGERQISLFHPMKRSLSKKIENAITEKVEALLGI